MLIIRFFFFFLETLFKELLLIFRCCVIVYKEFGQRLHHFECEESWDPVLIGEIKEADRPLLIAIECVHQSILYIFHPPRHLILIIMMANARM